MTIFYMHGAEGPKDRVKPEVPSSKWILKKPGMAHCFDFRMRTSSFDLHTLATGHRLARLGRLFRSKSTEEVKTIKSPVTSPKPSPKPSPGATPKRRFVRVVRNQDSEGEEYENPHLVRRFTKEYWEQQQQQQQLQKSKSLEMNYTADNLPYKVSGHTILKKHPSVDSDSSPPVTKHACFKENIEVFEFDKKSKIKKKMFSRHQERLIDSSADETDSDSEFSKMREQVKGKKAPPKDTDYSSEEEDTASVTDNIGEMCFSDAKKGEMTLTLTLIPGLDVNALCSPVKEEEEDSVTDTESEMSDIVFEDSKRRLCSSDSEMEMERAEEEEKNPQGVQNQAGRKHEVES